MDDSNRLERYAQELARQASAFLLLEAGKQSLLTVTRATVADDFHSATIYVSVFPESEQEKALAWLKRSRTEFRDFVAAKSPGLRPPTFDFEIDKGSENYNKIDEALKER